MKVLCIGHTSYDITCEVDNFVQENTKNRLNNSVRCGGGPASNAAYLLGKWGIDTSIATVLGSDDFAEKIKKEFAEVRVDTSCIETNFEQATSLSLIIVNKNNGNRTVFNVIDEVKPLKKMTYEFVPDIIFTDGHDYGATQNALAKYPQAISIIDAGRVTNELLELCKYIKYIVCSKGFAETVSGLQFDFNNPSTLVNIYQKLQLKYPNASIIVTLEDKGALYQNGNQIKIMPGLKVDVKDTTGAGDIFHGAFVYCIANNFEIEKTIAISNIAGGLSCRHIGGRNSVPPLSEVLEEYNKKVVAVRPTNEEANQQANTKESPQNQG
ncbi:MAG: carbohydrate kinase family protein [Firmicutes bacterium]|nr:carbohydrate kinase family protein [Bacillota bacterium]